MCSNNIAQMQLSHSRVFMLGPPQSGKTSFCNWLTGKSLTEKLFNVYEVAINNINFSLWDFANEPICSLADHLFFTPNAIYTCVLDINKVYQKVNLDAYDDVDLTVMSWFETIQVYSKEILIICTHADELEENSRNNKLKKIKQDAINFFEEKNIHILSVNCHSFDEQKCDQVQKYLRSRAKLQSISEIGHKLLQELPSKQVIKKSELSFSSNGVSIDESLLTLHNEGIILNFQSIEGLRDLIFLEPKNFIETLHSLLIHRKNFELNTDELLKPISDKSLGTPFLNLIKKCNLACFFNEKITLFHAIDSAAIDTTKFSKTCNLKLHTYFIKPITKNKIINYIAEISDTGVNNKKLIMLSSNECIFKTNNVWIKTRFNDFDISLQISTEQALKSPNQIKNIAKLADVIASEITCYKKEVDCLACDQKNLPISDKHISTDNLLCIFCIDSNKELLNLPLATNQIPNTDVNDTENNINWNDFTYKELRLLFDWFKPFNDVNSYNKFVSQYSLNKEEFKLWKDGQKESWLIKTTVITYLKTVNATQIDISTALKNKELFNPPLATNQIPNTNVNDTETNINWDGFTSEELTKLYHKYFLKFFNSHREFATKYGLSEQEFTAWRQGKKESEKIKSKVITYLKTHQPTQSDISKTLGHDKMDISDALK